MTSSSCWPWPVALMAWGLSECTRIDAAPRMLPWLLDVAAIARSGPQAWRVSASWGIRSRCLPDDPSWRQHTRDGCGAAALQALLRDHGTAVRQSLLWSMTRLPSGGSSARRLATVGARLGCHCRVLALAKSNGEDPGGGSGRLPAIVHLRRGHFVLLRAVGARTARVFDPACGEVLVARESLTRRASGVVITCACSHAPRRSTSRAVVPTRPQAP